MPNDIRRQASFTTIKVLNDGMNLDVQMQEFWTAYIRSTELRKLQYKKNQIKMQGTKCRPENPLHRLVSIDSKRTLQTKPVIFKIDDPKAEIEIYKYLPTLDPYIIQSTQDTKNQIKVTFKTKDRYSKF